MKKGMKKARICKILKDYQSGKLTKDEAMDKLDLDRVSDLLDLCAKYKILPDKTPFYWQSDPSAKPVEEYFRIDDS
jgi:hypothetical protein